MKFFWIIPVTGALALFISSCRSSPVESPMSDITNAGVSGSGGEVGSCPTPESKDSDEIRGLQLGRYKTMNAEETTDWSTSFLYSRGEMNKGKQKGITPRDAQWAARKSKSVCSRRMNHDAIIAGTVYETGVFKSKISSAVGDSASNNLLRYAVFSRDEEKQGHRRTLNCVLVHGYGTTGLGVAAASDDKFLFFGAAYYGTTTVDALLDTVCQRVYVIVQESNDTSILEMTLRTEDFLREIPCSGNSPASIFDQPQWQCGLIGHSKGGAVVSNIARRCMNMTSDLGETACKNIGEIYSATGIVLGSGSTFLLYGAYKTQDSAIQDQILGSFYELDWATFSGGVSEFISKAKGRIIGLAWKVFSPYEQNPTWRDLNPGAKLEGGVPLAVINNVALNKRGWLRADYAASGVDFVFSGKKVEVLGVGTPSGSIFGNESRQMSEAFGYGIQTLHRNEMKKLFDDGVRYLSQNNFFFDPTTQNAAYMKRFTWAEYQVGDGLVELSSALGMCRNGGTAVKTCTTLHNINHAASAGLAKEAQRDYISQFAVGDAP